MTLLIEKIFTSTIDINQLLHVASSPQIIKFLELRYDDFWIYSISNKLQNLMLILTKSDTAHFQIAKDHSPIYTYKCRFLKN